MSVSAESMINTEVNQEVTEAPVTEKGAPPAEGQAPAWMWSDDTAGNGDKPEWFMDSKYKTVAEQAKAYPELQSKLGSHTGAPDKYDLSLPEDIDLPEGVGVNVNEEDPLLQGWIEHAKATNMNQEAFTGGLKLWAEAQAREYIDPVAHVTAQKEILGKDADKRISDLTSWAKANFDEETFSLFSRVSTSADSILLTEAFVNMIRPSSVPDVNALTGQTRSALTQELADLRAAKDDKGGLKWFSDSNHRNKIEQLQRQLGSNAPDVTIVK
jgi:hypothetical protein